MKPLSKIELDRFGKLLGMLGSDQAGERAAAAFKATEFLKSRQMVWGDIAAMIGGTASLQESIHTYKEKKRSHDEDYFYKKKKQSHNEDASYCLNSGVKWRPNERTFLEEMSVQLRKPSEKQRNWLDSLVDIVNQGRRQGYGR